MLEEIWSFTDIQQCSYTTLMKHTRSKLYLSINCSTRLETYYFDLGGATCFVTSFKSQHYSAQLQPE